MYMEDEESPVTADTDTIDIKSLSFREAIAFRQQKRNQVI